MFEYQATPIDGVTLVRPTLRPDDRGSFVKLIHEPSFREAGLVTHYEETYISASHRGVVRGMHFQAPPHDHAKLVYCLSGRVLDVVVDIRRSSPTFGCSYSVELDGSYFAGVYIPRGLAHGFLSLADGSQLQYFVETAHAPSHDLGLHWDSFGFAWPEAPQQWSARDDALPRWPEFSSPF